MVRILPFVLLAGCGEIIVEWAYPSYRVDHSYIYSDEPIICDVRWRAKNKTPSIISVPCRDEQATINVPVWQDLPFDIRARDAETVSEWSAITPMEHL